MLPFFFHTDLPALNLVARAVIVYLAVLILLRVSGKRQLGQMGATEFVAVLLISNAVQNSMNGGDNSLGAGLLLATVLVILSAGISYLTYRSDLFSRIFEGSPTLLIHNGKIVRKGLSHEKLSEGELKTLLRKQGIHRIAEIKTAILEADGTLTVVRPDDKPALSSDPQDLTDI
ncbi:MAG: DUF421 domain-containing protein [Proteobacteria bacterium]|nr:MAG: DUF421 domain-containing protein [Pseudomonadota bacterium]